MSNMIDFAIGKNLPNQTLGIDIFEEGFVVTVGWFQ